MGITGDPGHGTEGHLLPLTGEHCGGRAQAGLGEPQMLSTSMEAHALCFQPYPITSLCFVLGTRWGRVRAGTQQVTAGDVRWL